jgi:hypothetical protein
MFFRRLYGRLLIRVINHIDHLIVTTCLATGWILLIPRLQMTISQETGYSFNAFIPFSQCNTHAHIKYQFKHHFINTCIYFDL